MLNAIIPKFKNGKDPFTFRNKELTLCLEKFWSWAYSDLMNNTTRGVLAEYIIASALKLDSDNPREPWNPFDLEYRKTKIEIKSAAYIQSWKQKSLSKIQFNIEKTRAWDKETNKHDPISKRQADYYIFAVYIEKDKQSANPMNLDKWEFYVVKTEKLNTRRRSQHSITLNSLESMLLKPIKYDELKIEMDKEINK